MAVERCNRCGNLIDMDWNTIDYIGPNMEPVCEYCLTDKEADKIDAEFNGEVKNAGTNDRTGSTNPRPLDNSKPQPVVDAIRNSGPVPLPNNVQLSPDQEGQQLKALNFALNKVYELDDNQ